MENVMMIMVPGILLKEKEDAGSRVARVLRRIREWIRRRGMRPVWAREKISIWCFAVQ